MDCFDLFPLFSSPSSRLLATDYFVIKLKKPLGGIRKSYHLFFSMETPISQGMYRAKNVTLHRNCLLFILRTFSITDYIASSGRMNNKFERIWKWLWPEVLSHHLSEATGKQRTKARIASVLAKIWTQHLSNTSLRALPLDHPVQQHMVI
jgi:hypothetical protein